MEISASSRRDILQDPAQQESFYQSSKAWIEALAERNDLAGQLTVMPNDPDRFPYQRLGVGFIDAFRPALEDLGDISEAEIQSNVLRGLRHSVGEVIGEENFVNFSRDLLRQSTAPVESLSRQTVVQGPPGSALRTVLHRLKVRHNNVSLVGYHPNIIALPIYAAEFIEAARLMEESESSQPFNLFGLTEQMVMPINKSLAFAEYQGIPVVERLALLSGVSLKVPSTASSRLFGIDSEMRKAANEEAEDQFEEYLGRLDSKGKSALLITDPTGSTAERLSDDSGNLNGLRFRRITPGSYDQLNRFNFAWPVTMWWDKDPKAAKWFVGHPASLGYGDTTSRFVHGLAYETGRLAGVDVYFGKNDVPLGQVALGAAPPPPAQTR